MKKYNFTINDAPYEVSINSVKNGIADLSVNGKQITVSIKKEEPVVAKPEPQKTAQIIESKPLSAFKQPVSGNMPHTIIKVFVASGQHVKQGDVLFTLESQGNTCDVTADKEGVIDQLNLAVGEHLPLGDNVIKMHSDANTASNVDFSSGTVVPSPLPGTIVQIIAKEGRTIAAGELVLTMDSMKMVNNVNADKNGTIAKILVKEGQSVLEGDPLFIIV